MKRTAHLSLVLLLLAFPVLSLQGCQTLPAGWEEADSDDIGQLSILLQDLLHGDMEADAQMKLCIASSGAAAGLSYWNNRNADLTKTERLLEAVREADEHAKKYFGDLYDQYGGLDGIIATAIGYDGQILDQISESELILALLHAIIQGDFLAEVSRAEAVEAETVLTPQE